MPVKIGYPLAAMIMGLSPLDGYSVIYDSGNGLQTSATMEKKIDPFRISFVPILPLTDPIELKSIILDDSLLNKKLLYSNTSWSEFHERKLVFIGDGRPHLRFVYFHFLISMLKQKALNPKTAGIALAKYAEKFAASIKAAFPDAGEWYNGSLLRFSAIAMGDDADLKVLFTYAEEGNEKKNDDPMSEAYGRQLAALAGGCTWQSVRDMLEDDDDDDDDDDDV